MTIHLSRIAVVAAALEATPGTATAPTLPADADIVAYDPAITVEPQVTPRNPVHSKLSKLGSSVGGRAARFTFRTELKGSGTAGTAPSFGALLQACGLKETVVAVTSVTYTPDDETTDKTVTIDFYQHNRRFRLVGCKGNFKIMAESGSHGMIEWEFRGKLDPTNPLTNDGTAALASITYESTKPPVFMGTNIATFFTVNPLLNRFEFDAGNVLTLVPSANDPTGYKRSHIVDRNPSGSLDPEMIENATFANTFIGRWLNATSGALSVVIGATAGNIITISAAANQIQQVSPGDREGIGVDQVQFQITGTLDADAEYSIAFT